MIVVGSKAGIALGTLALSGLVARLDALKAKDVVALRQDDILPSLLATGAG